MPDRVPTFPPNTRVALRPGMEEVYPNAVAGQVGWIRDSFFDDHGFERVAIEWDKKHWRYAGVKDMLTYPGHFRLAVDDDDAHGEADVGEEGVSLLDRLAQLGREDVPEEAEPTAEMQYCEGCGGYHPVADERWQSYYATLQKAFEVAGDSGNFILLTMAPHPDFPDQPAIPHLYSNAVDAIDPQLYVQMSWLAHGALDLFATERSQRGRTSSDLPPDSQ